MVSAAIVYRDVELGPVEVRPDSRARRFVFRCRGGCLLCICPVPYSEAGLRAAIEALRPRLRAFVERSAATAVASPRGFDGRTTFDAAGFRFRMEESSACVRPVLKVGPGTLTCFHPPGQQWDDEALQRWLSRAVGEALRVHAESVLPPRLEVLAATRGLRYAEVCVTRTRSRWGSCDTRRRINLSLYVLLLPPHLQDYVMQHELTHLVEMNHGPRFWALLDSVTGGRARALRLEMKNYTPSFF